MNYPGSLTTSKDGFVLAADERNHRILVLSPSLSEARPLSLNVDGELRNPVGLCFDQSSG